MGGRKVMLEKIVLTITITFSLNLLLQMQQPNTNIQDGNYYPGTQNPPSLLVWGKTK